MKTNSADERRSPRNNVLLRATVDSEAVHVPVRVSNLSRHGALALGKKLPPEGTEVVFRCKGVTIPSWIAWVRDDCAGIQFADCVEPETFARDEAFAHLIVKDTRAMDFRRPGFRGNQMTPEERAVVEEWAKARNLRVGT